MMTGKLNKSRGDMMSIATVGVVPGVLRSSNEEIQCVARNTKHLEK